MHWLKVAFNDAQERLKTAALHRKKAHDRHVRGEPLREGQLVLLRDFSARGWHKLQDPWGSTVFRVVKAPKEGGAVYSIAPTDDQTKVRHVHRTLLKAVLGAESPSGAAASDPPLPDRPVEVDAREEES